MNLSLKGRVFKIISSPSPRDQAKAGKAKPPKEQVQDLSRENILTIWFWNHVLRNVRRPSTDQTTSKRLGKIKPVYGLTMDWYVLFDFINNF